MERKDVDQFEDAIVRAVTKALHGNRTIPEDEHTAHHLWAAAKIEKEQATAKIVTHMKFIAIGVITVTGIGLVGKSLLWIGELVWAHFTNGGPNP